MAVLKLTGNAGLLRYIDDPDSNGRSSLHWAVRNGHVAIMNLLIQAGADPRKPDRDGWTCMHYACRYRRPDCVKILLASKHGSVLVSAKEALGATPLHVCSASGVTDCAILVATSKKAPDLDAKNIWGQTPLMLAAALGGKGVPMMEMLLTAGADPKVRDFEGSSAFHYAASSGAAYGLERLLKGAYHTSHAPPGGRKEPSVVVQSVHNKYGDSAYNEAEARGWVEARDYLAKHKDTYDINDDLEEDSDDTDSDDEQDKDVYGEGCGQRIQPTPKRIQVEAAKQEVAVAV